MKKSITVVLIIIICAGLLFSVYGCFKPIKMKVGVVNKQKLLTNWPKYRDLMGEYQVERDLLVSKLPKESSSLTQQQKDDVEKMSKKWSEKGKVLEDEFTKAAEGVAKKKKLGIVISDYTVEYGGIDITNEIKEKLQ